MVRVNDDELSHGRQRTRTSYRLRINVKESDIRKVVYGRIGNGVAFFREPETRRTLG